MFTKKEKQEISALEANLSKLTKEEDVTKYLCETKPPYLKMGQEQWLDRNVLLDQMKGLQDKLLINGYEDRAVRLKYLTDVLMKKWVNKPAAYNSMLNFLIETTEHPTGILSLDLLQTRYSESPEPIVFREPEDEKEVIAERKRQEVLKQEIVKELLERSAEEAIEFNYSSDSEANSDWELSDVEEGSSGRTPEKGGATSGDEEGIWKARTRRQIEAEAEAARKREKKRSVEEFWQKECTEAGQILECNIRKAEPMALGHQPVISSTLTLHSKFGEFWEWKKQNERPPPANSTVRLILMESDIIREILWQLTSPSSERSVIFRKDWSSKPEIMLSSLTQSALCSLLSVYSEILPKVEILTRFIDGVEQNRIIVKGEGMLHVNHCSPSKMYRTYAFALSEILRNCNRQIAEIELNLKSNTDFTTATNHAQKPCTTLIQLNYQLKSYFQLIRALEAFHSQTVVNSPTTSHWFSSIKLISALQCRLNQELRLPTFKIWLYLFIQCLFAFLDSILSTLETLRWTDPECYFVRKEEVELCDSNFWKDSIISQPIRAQLKEASIPPLSCLGKLIPKLLTMLKIEEMVNLLNEEKNFEVVLGILPTKERIVDQLMMAILPEASSPVKLEEENQLGDHAAARMTMTPEEFDNYLNYLGLLKNSDMKDCFAFMFTDELRQPDADDSPVLPVVAVENLNWTKLDTFLANVQSVPETSMDKHLDDVMEAIFDPYFQTTRTSLQGILDSYRVNDSIRLFREIVLGEREDFAQAVDVLAKRADVAPIHSYEDEKYRNPFYQKLLNETYPEGRENFDIEFNLEPSTDLNYKLIVRAHFPLNLLLTPKSIDAYLAISRQLHSVRKCLWALNGLNIKKFKSHPGVEPRRVLFFRFALLHFFSSFRSFLLLKIFSTGFDWTQPISPLSDLDSIIKAHENYLYGIKTRILQDRFLNDMILKKMTKISNVLCERWEEKGLKLQNLIILEDTIYKCWTFLYDFSNSKHSTSICNELAGYIGPVPQYLRQSIPSLNN